ncbi:hypothetical protein DCAR_0414449 [Daucus carota subsp. sativus]|uniref:Uncharacterized protein n=1 Tax=Daucus carota subsp. sativus TaxID=79200 RepID=A0A175YAW1_DAUCS|nr:hypothetical protein DCAR_0414449 [Daucus carota subsp. sativus]
MDSQAQISINQITAENKFMEERIKRLEEENAKLQHKIKLMDIHQSNDEAVIDLLKKHIEERRELNHFVMDDSNFEPSKIAKRKMIKEAFKAEAESRKFGQAAQVDERIEGKY